MGPFQMTAGGERKAIIYDSLLCQFSWCQCDIVWHNLDHDTSILSPTMIIKIYLQRNDRILKLEFGVPEQFTLSWVSFILSLCIHSLTKIYIPQSDFWCVRAMPYLDIQNPKCIILGVSLLSNQDLVVTAITVPCHFNCFNLFLLALSDDLLTRNGRCNCQNSQHVKFSWQILLGTFRPLLEAFGR